MIDICIALFCVRRKIFLRMLAYVIVGLELFACMIFVSGSDIKPIYNSTDMSVYFEKENRDFFSPSPTPLVTVLTPTPESVSSPTPEPVLTPSPSVVPGTTDNIIKPVNTPENDNDQIIKYPIRWGDRSKKEICLTFDDGYDPAVVKNTLDILKKKDVRSTFFVIGMYLTDYPYLWKRAVEDGHFVCNHTNNHKNMVSLSEKEMREQITDWEKAAKDVLGEEYFVTMKSKYPYFRLPGGNGSNDKDVLKMLKEYGYTPVGWSLETYNSVIRHYDYINGPSKPIIDKILQHVVDNCRKGCIALLHLNHLDTPKLDLMIDGIREKGFTIRNLDEMLDTDK